MKKILFLSALISFCFGKLDAQELYRTVYENAIAVVNDAKSTDEQIQINQFKITALNTNDTFE
jgi:hypothetical protein